MLESMTAMEYQEWMAFFKIRSDREKAETGDKPETGYGTSPDEQKRMSGDILRSMTSYQNRRDKQKGTRHGGTGK